MKKLIPGKPVPELKVNTVNGKIWDLNKQTPQHFTMIVVYRGLHCPICRRYLLELQEHLDEFINTGVEVIAISSDPKEKAIAVKEKWKLDKLNIGYGLSIEKGRDWGLFVSRDKGLKNYPDIFLEPGLFLIRPDRTLYASIVSTMPFARPSFGDVLKSLGGIIQNDYPAQGEA